MLTTVLVTIVVFLVRYSSAAYDHSYFNSMSERCRENSSCSGNASTNFAIYRNCQCDAQCAIYGDCCQDSPHFKPSSLRQCVRAGDWNTPAKYSSEYYMVKSCPSTWEEEETRSKCENYTANIRNEPTLGHPVTSNATNITYVNHHCAKCNGDLGTRTTIRWKLAVTCGAKFPLPLPDINEIMKKATCGDDFKFKPKFANSSYHTCQLYVWRPIKLLRRCHLKTFVTCPLSWHNETVREQCEAYTSLVFRRKNTPYRNPHCATCNNVPDRLTKCEKEDIEIETGFPELFDFSDKSSDDVGRAILCPNEYEAFDVTAKECRPFSLNIAGQNNARKIDNCSADFSYNPNKCKIFIFKREEYRLNDNCTVEVFLHKKVYGEGKFRITEENYLELCADYLETREKFDGPITYLIYLGFGVSIGFLFLHLVVFATNPALRNLSDKSLAALCTAMLVAYGAYISGRLLSVGSMACKVTAIVTYYSFLSSFSWLLLIAFDVWYVLRLSVTRLRIVSRQSRRYAFITYALLGWLLFPLILVSAALFMEYLQDEPTFRPRFGVHNCWFGSRKAMSVFFGIPVLVVMVMNFYFFVSSGHMICTSKMSSSNKSSNTDSNCKLFARLSLLMGLTWMVGFFADYLGLEAVWYIYVVLNAFQGLYIFLTFGLTKKVRGGYRKQFSVEVDTSTSCWSRTRSKMSSYTYSTDLKRPSETKR